MENLHFPWGHAKRYNAFPAYARLHFQKRIQKISVDAGFTCPNRDGTKGTGGCTYCNNQAFSPPYCDPTESISSQLQKGIDFFSGKYPSMHFLAYFQSYSNTYAPLDVLKKKYNEALRHPKVIGLVIATRPDCLEPEVLDYLADLSCSCYIMLELGIESHLNATLERINRCHTFQDSVHALEETRRRGIRTCAHMILGLPGEEREHFLDQARAVSRLPVDHLKLHQLQIHKNTILEKQYRKSPGDFHLFTAEEYTERVVDYLEQLNPRIIVERFISQAPPEWLVAPRWGIKNYAFVERVNKKLEERNTWQGRLFEAISSNGSE
jgi:uncharacterized protein